MALKPALGTMVCPECGLDGAEIKQAKSGLLYRWCPDCNAQYFSRTPEASARLGLKGGIGAPVTAIEPPKTPAAPVTVTETKPPERDKRAGFDLGL